MYYLYWIRYQDHTDPKTQGYIGISSRPDDRFLEHKRGQKNKILPRVISKGASMEILLEGFSLEKALLEESKYRPEEKIGWNIAKGGDIPPSKRGHKYKQGKQILKGQQRTDAQKLASLYHKEKMSGRIPWNKGLPQKEENKPYKKCIYKGIEFNSQKEAAEYFGVSQGAVSKWLRANRNSLMDNDDHPQYQKEKRSIRYHSIR